MTQSDRDKKCRFVGEVDLPESERGDPVYPHNHTHRMCQDLEPLLVESRRRFVLFPIQYPDVSRFVPTCFVGFSHGADMEDVQASPGILLERGRDQLDS
jgi:hypothetical protein